MEIWFEVEFGNHEQVSSVTSLLPTNLTLNTAMLVINKWGINQIAWSKDCDGWSMNIDYTFTLNVVAAIFLLIMSSIANKMFLSLNYQSF